MDEKEVLEIIKQAGREGGTKLDLSDKGLTSLPDEIGQLTKLEKLELAGNKLTALPEGIGKLANLQTLDLSDNQMTVVPEWMGKLTKLQEFNLTGNKLTAVPEWIGNLTNLQELELGNNQLRALPDGIGKLASLQELALNDNKLTAVPEGIGKLANLKELYLTDNQLTTVPEGIGKLAKLKSLNLGGNQLTTVPEWIGKLTNLQGLWLADNQLTAVPEGIGKLAKLQYLALDDNQLTAVPEGIGKLAKLNTLWLYGNELTAVPESLGKLVNLEELYLHGNDELGIPPEVLGPIWEEAFEEGKKAAKPGDILDYYFRTREGERRPLNEAKLILVGYGAVGKTSLVNRLVHGRFDKDEEETKGINITQWPIELGEDEKVRLNVWDFGGQEIMHSTHQFFLSQRSVYVLVLNGRQGHEDGDAEYWLNLIKSFGEDSPVIVVLNKIKEHPFDLNRGGLKEKFGAICEFVETECEDGTGIDKLKEVIFRETDGLEHLRDAFPASWFAIKDALAGMDENYVTYEQYREICAKYGEGDWKSQEMLALHLHHLGVALNFKDDVRLRDTHVLNPHWVTKGIYTIINSAKLWEQEGEIRLNELGEILDAKAYPMERHYFLMELMRKFELCFDFPEGDGHYLVPELLAKEQAREALDFVQEDCLNFEYHYPIPPERLLPRFIVRTHALSKNSERWRTGVILEFEGNRALVRAERQEQRIVVSVKGPKEGRRRLLAVIRSDFEHIHGSFAFEPKEMVAVPGHPEVAVSYNELLVMERSRIKELPKAVGDKVINVDVQDMLNGVDVEGSRRREAMDVSKAIRIFYSYSHKNEKLRNELETHLKLMQRQGLIVGWHDRKITAGTEWKGEIDENLERADIILLLVSADFMASDYCYDVEMERAMERHEANEARVVPVILRDVDWKDAPFAKLNALPTDGKAVKLWRNRDSAWRDVSEGIKKVVGELLGK